MSPPRARTRLLGRALGVSLGVGACATLSADEVRALLLGLEARSVVDCLGAPHTLVPMESEGHQVWVYAAELPQPRSERLLDPALDGAGSGQPIRLPPSIALPAGLPLPWGPRTRSQQARAARDLRPGTCVLAFELRDGVVSDFRSFGRRHNGGGGDNRCAWTARRCIPPEAGARGSQMHEPPGGPIDPPGGM